MKGIIVISGLLVTGCSDNSSQSQTDNSSQSQTDNLSWSGTKQLGTSSSVWVGGITSDASGNVYVTAYTYGSLDNNSNAGRSDVFVVKYNNTGVKQWTQQLGTSNHEDAAGITSDSSGNVYVTGSTYGGLDNNTDAEGTDTFLVKYDESGVKQWTRQLRTSTVDTTTAITSDSRGNVYVTGYRDGSYDNISNFGCCQLFLIKYDEFGVEQWNQQILNSQSFGFDTTCDSSGNVYVTGYVLSILDNNTNAGGADAFVMKYNESGVKQWTQQFGTSTNDYANGITSDPSGNVYVTGYTDGSLNNTNAGENDAFVIKYNESGVKQWTQQFGTSTDDYGNGITSDSSGNVYVTGHTDGSLDNNSNVGGYDAFVVKYDSSGVKQWTRQFGTSTTDVGREVAHDSGGNLYISGHTDGSLDGNSNAGGSDVFVVKYDSSGVKQ